MKNRNIKGITLVLQDFHYFEKDEYPRDINFCFLILNDGTYTAGRWWPSPSDSTKGGFVRGTAETVDKEDVKAWLELDAWKINDPAEYQSESRITVGSDESLTVEIGSFHSIKDGELPQDDQYCFLILNNNYMSGGRWSSGGKYLETGYFNHGPAASIIDADEVWAWAAMDPFAAEDLVVKTPAEAAEEQRKIEERIRKEKEKREARRLKPEKKFKYGMDVQVYIDKALKQLQENYPWVTENNLDPQHRFAIEEEEGNPEYVEYRKYSDDEDWERVILDGCFDEDMDAKSFISHIFSCNEYHVISNNKVVAEYDVPFESKDLGGGWHLERYVFRKRKSGHFTVEVTAGDRNTGAGREFGVTQKCMQQPTFEKFLDEYAKVVPGGPFGLYKEDLIGDEKLKEFLGYKK